MANYAAFGAILQQFDTTNGYVTIGQIGDDLQAPALALAAVDVTSHDSPNEFREQIGGGKDIGDVGFSLRYDPALASHVALWTALDNRSVEVFKMIFPDAGNTEWAFRALVTGFVPQAPVDSHLAAAVTLEGTGEPRLDDDFTFLVDDVGAYLVDDTGAVLIEV